MLKTGSQLRSARVLASLDVETLSRLSGVAVKAIELMEASQDEIVQASFVDIVAVSESLKRIGLDFIDGNPPLFRMRNSDSGTKAKTIDVGTKNILVADDDRHNRYILKKRLTRIGFSVTDVETGEEAIAAMSQSRFRAVLLDSLLPRMSGIDVVRLMRTNNNHTRVIMISGKVFAEDIQRAYDSGADNYVTKPIDFTRLVDLINAPEGN